MASSPARLLPALLAITLAGAGFAACSDGSRATTGTSTTSGTSTSGGGGEATTTATTGTTATATTGTGGGSTGTGGGSTATSTSTSTGAGGGSTATSSSTSTGAGGASSATSTGTSTGAGGAVEPPPPCNINQALQITQYSNDNNAAISVVWNGSEYAAFYRDVIAGQFGVYFSRWSKSGIQQGPPKLVIALPNPAQVAYYYPKTVWNGTGYGVLLSYFTLGGSNLQLATYDAMGAQITAPTNVVPGPFWSYDYDIVWTGTEYGIVFSWGGDAYFARMSAAGAPVGAYLKIGAFAGGAGAPSLAWSGNEYGITRNNSGDILFTRVSAVGAPLIADVTVAQGGTPKMVWNSTKYAIAWSAVSPGAMDVDAVMIREVSENGTPLGSAVQVVKIPNADGLHHAGNAVDLRWNGTGYALAWVSNQIEPKGYEVYFARLDPALQKQGGDVQVTAFGARDPFNYFSAANFPALLWNGEEYIARWQDYLGPQKIWNGYMKSICY